MSRGGSRLDPSPDLLCVFGRRAPPGKCKIRPAQVKVKSRLIPFVPKESKYSSVGKGLLLPQGRLGPGGTQNVSTAPVPGTMSDTMRPTQCPRTMGTRHLV